MSLEQIENCTNTEMSPEIQRAAVFEEVSCNLCGEQTRTQLLFEAKPDFDNRSFRVVRCEQCNLVYLNPRPSAEALLQFYRPDYYGFGDAKFDEVTERAVALFVEWRAKVLEPLVPAGGRVLDIGCGRGNFLEVMSDRGFEVYGTELTEHSAMRARKRFPERIAVGGLDSAGFANGSFDMVTVWHVIEHLPDPCTTLAEINRILKPGGIVVLAQPNIESIQAKIGGAKWFHLDVPRHLYHFSPRTLGAMLDRTGYEVTKVSHYSIEQNPYGLVQSVLNRCGFPQNYLYHVLKNEGFKVSRASRVGYLSAYYCLMPIAIALTAVGSALGRGGSFYIVARKRGPA